MKSDILKVFDEIIALGDQVRATRSKPAPNHITSDFVDVEIANRWFVRALNLIARTVGEESEHYQALKRQFVDYPKWPNVNQAYGVVTAARDDVEGNVLFEIKALVESEVFDDLLEQAETLFLSGYYAPAAVIVGCVLEDGLRKLCKLHDIDGIDSIEKLDRLNSELAKRGVYKKLTQKKITALADIRNSAAHGKWDDFDKSDVEGMLKWVREFMEKYYS